jgi:hypothetical protein
MEGFVAGEADNQRFSVAGGHRFDPCWLFRPTILVEVLECANMVDFNLLVRATEFTCFRKQALDNFCPAIPVEIGIIVEHGIHASLQGDATPLGNERIFSFPLNDRLQSFVGFSIGNQSRTEVFIDLVRLSA